MTNKEMYEKIFGMQADTSNCPTSDCNVCPCGMKDKLGEWKRHDEWRNGEYIGGFYHVNCPCEDGYYSKWETNFCPNCGQPMMKGGAI